jgi:GMP synthase (glutamine-hydrolysing)
MILIVDFGSQTAHLIGRRLRQIGSQIEYVSPEEALEQIKKLKPHGIILSGGPSSVYEKEAPTISKEVFAFGIPVLGICYGWQLMAYLLDAKIKNTKKEYGPEEITLNSKATTSQLLKDLPKTTFSVIVSHGDSVITLPIGFTTLAQTKTATYSAVENVEENLYGIQFHPEAHHTEYGVQILKNFALLCKEKLQPISLDPKKIIADIKETVGNQKVICAVSGGVDSTVAAFLIAKAIGKNLLPVYVESGLMRQDTDKHVSDIFQRLERSNLIIIDAKKRFIDSLKGITDSEQKRKIIGRLYVEIFQEVANKHNDAAFLGQGTIYSDVIESKGSKHASHIKSHHNVGGLPKDIKLKLLEPLRNFYKDEVREIGRKAGLPEEIVMQQPWPGPGHAVNIMGEVTEKRLAQVMQADQIVVEEMQKAGLYEKVFECFAIMTGAYSTAVKGDARVFAEVIAIRSYDSVDIMTAEWSRIPHNVLAIMSSRIVNEVPDVSRVVYDITTKPPATMRWE